MGQYRLSIYWILQLGFLIKATTDEVVIDLPGISLHIATTKYAGGFFIFGHYFSGK
jgi:hypothetical protein